MYECRIEQDCGYLHEDSFVFCYHIKNAHGLRNFELLQLIREGKVERRTI